MQRRARVERWWRGAMSAAVCASSAAFARAQQSSSMFWCREYWSGVHDWSLRLGDFDEDGMLDLLTTGQTTKLLLRRGKADGTFGAASASPTGFNTPFRVTSGDFDGDGHLDAAVTPFSYSADVAIFPGNGDGTFRPHVDVTTSSSIEDQPGEAAFADLDGDGIPDLVTLHWDTDVVHVFKGLGNFAYSAGPSYPTADGPVNLALVELNGDAWLDLVLLSYYVPTVQIRFGDGVGGFGAVQDVACGWPVSLDAADIDGDGACDLVVVDAVLDRITPLWNDGSGHFALGAGLSIGSPYPRNVCVGDFDGDGVRDLVGTDRFRGTLAFLRGLGLRQFAAPSAFVAGDGIDALLRCDLDRNGVDDVAFVQQFWGWSSRVGVIPGKAGVGPAPPDSFAVPSTPNVVVAADLDADGHADCVVAGTDWTSWANDVVSVSLGDGHAGFALADSEPVRGRVQRVVVADFDGDGDLDVVASSAPPTPSASLLRGDGAGSLATSEVVLALGEISDLCAARVDADGRDDLIAVLPQLGSITVQRGQASGLGVATRIVIGTSGADADLGDVDGDGDLDLVVAGSDGRVVVARGNGAGDFAPTTVASTSTALTALALADFDGDGKLDIVVAGTGGAAFALRGNGSGAFLPPVVFDVLEAPGEMVAADVNADGIVDLAAAQARLRYAITVSIGDGLGGFGAPRMFNGGSAYVWGSGRIAFADFDEDQRTDLALPGYGSTILLQLQRDTWPVPTAYCTAGTSSQGCVANLSASGPPSASATSGFVLSVDELDGQRSCALFHGVSGATAVPWASSGASTSFLCVQPPVQRTSVQSSGGTLFQCDGALALDWASFMHAHPTAIGAPTHFGQTFWAQAWYRDPPAPRGSNLSNGLTFTLVP